MKGGGGRIHLSTHVAAIALNKDKEALAEELMHKQEHNLELQQQVVSTNIDRVEPVQGGQHLAAVHCCTGSIRGTASTATPQILSLVQ